MIADVEASSALSALKPSSTIRLHACHCWVLKSSIDRPIKLTALSPMPPAATMRSPRRPTSTPAIGPLNPLATITGSMNIPASNGVKPCTNCNSCAISSSKPTSAIMAVIAMTTPLKIMRWQNRRMSIIGTRARSWIRTKINSITAPVSSVQATIHGDSTPFRAVLAL